MKRLLTAVSIFLLVSGVAVATDWQQSLKKLVKNGFENVASATAADMTFDMSQIEKNAASRQNYHRSLR